MKEELEIVVKDNGAKKTIGDIRKELKESREEMLNLEPGSKAFLQAAKNAGELQHQLTQINEAVKGASSDFGDMVGNVAKVGAGITGAFQAAKGAMSLFGIESENVTEAISKMQNLMAMTQGLSSIDEGIKSFSKLKTVVGLNNKELGGFKKALIGTGLGALVVLLGSIIANWEDFTKEIGLSSDQMNKFGDMFSGVMNVVLKSTGKIAKAFANIIKGDFKGAWEEIKTGWDFQQMYAEGVQGAITKRETTELEKRKEARKTYVDQMEAEYDRQRSKAEATIQDEKERTNELIRIEQERLKLYADGTKEYYDQVKKINDLQASLNKDSGSTDQKEDPEITKLRNKVQALKDSYRTELQIINDNEALKNQAIKDALNKGLIDQQTYETLATQIKAEAEAERTRIEKEEELKREEIAEQAKQKQVDTIHSISNIAQAASGLLTDALNSMADAQDANTKEGFERQKKLQIAAATIQMLTGIATAFTGAYTTKSGPWDFALMGIQAATIAASGIANIAKIKKQKFDSGASSGASSTHVSSAAAHINTPVQYTQDIQGASIESAIKDTRVYVTEMDITDTQNKVSVAESENRY